MALQPFSSHVHHTQALYEETRAKTNDIFCSIVFEFNIMNNWCKIDQNSGIHLLNVPTDATETVWPTQVQLSEWLFVSILKKNRPRSITGMTPAIPPMTHVLKANNVSTNYKAAVRNGSVAWNERSERPIAVQCDRRWTKQRDTQRGDIIRWGDFSLASSQSGHSRFWLNTLEQKTRLLLVNSSCAHGTHLYAQTYVVRHREPKFKSQI